MSWSIHASVHKETSMIHQKLITFAKLNNPKTEFKNPATFAFFTLNKSSITTCNLKDKTPCDERYKTWAMIHCPPVYCMGNGDPEELSDEDEELCPVECVREIKTDEELVGVLEKAKGANSLVVVDFYRTSCGSCKYIEQGFAKLCKGLGDEEAAVIFLKHNVIDEYDEQSEIAERLRIKSVPLFHFYKNGILLEAFATRDKVRIKEAIEKYTAPASTAAQNA
uniref:thioredoxin-like 4, chloroplastic n=1 Tax=Erigeron canadensis TaxID=72917 RepID=UPI001CB8C7A8|nr:thioredoxin-like 4, chloroplastic [Erigeron canadensis]